METLKQLSHEDLLLIIKELIDRTNTLNEYVRRIKYKLKMI